MTVPSGKCSPENRIFMRLKIGTMKTVKFVFATIFQNGGDATRAIELAKAVRDHAPAGYDARIVFLSRGSRFEQQALDEGFSIYRAEPPLGGVQYLDDFGTRFGELIGSTALAKEILLGELDAYRNLRPDVLVYGFWPIGSIARRMAIPHTPAVAFLPLPLEEPFLGTVHRFPDEMPLSRLPESVQRSILRSVPQALKERMPALRHGCIRRAAEEAGWTGEPLSNIFRMLRSDCYLVNDFPDFYPPGLFDRRVVFTGPLFSRPASARIEDRRIIRTLSSDNPKPKLFCTLGTSGSREALFEVIRMFNAPGCAWSGVVLCPPSICELSEAQALSRNPDVVLTDAFVPAAEVNALADAVICHGGQGTLQTAMLSGTPLVGMAAQPEQQMNLQHLSDYGAAIALSRRDWSAPRIARAVERLLGDSRFKAKAQRLRRRGLEMDSRQIAAEAIWRRAGV